MITYELAAGFFLLLSYIAAKQYRHKPSLVFACVCACPAVWSLELYFLSSINELSRLMFLFRLSRIGMFFIAPLLLLFAALTARRASEGWVLAVIVLSFGSSLFLSVANFMYPSPLLPTPIGYSPAGDNITAMHQANFALCALLSVWLTWRAYSRAGERERLQTGWILAACGIALFFGLLSFSRYHIFGTFGGVLTAAIITYVITNYRLLNYRSAVSLFAAKLIIVGLVGGVFWLVAKWLIALPALGEEENITVPAFAFIGLWVVIEAYPHLVNSLHSKLERFMLGRPYNVAVVIKRAKVAFANCDTPHQLRYLVDDILGQYVGVKSKAIYLSANFLWRKGRAYYFVNLAGGDRVISEEVLPPLSAAVAQSAAAGRAVYAIDNAEFGPGFRVSAVSAIVPICFKGRSVGMLILGEQDKDAFSADDQVLLGVVGQQLGVVLERMVAIEVATLNLHQKLQNEQLSQEFKRIIHDLKNPIGGIMNMLQMVELPDAEKHVVTEAADGALRVINQALETLKGGGELGATLQLNDIIRRVAERFRHSSIKLELNELPPLFANEQELESLLDNLLKNAIEAEGVRGREQTVAVKTWYEPDRSSVACRVSDRGGGLPESIRSNIWESRITTKAQGSGLGLPIIKHIIDRHSGAIAVDSTPGKGVAFTFSLPVDNRERRAIPALVSGDASPVETSSPG